MHELRFQGERGLAHTNKLKQAYILLYPFKCCTPSEAGNSYGDGLVSRWVIVSNRKTTPSNSNLITNQYGGVKHSFVVCTCLTCAGLVKSQHQKQNKTKTQHRESEQSIPFLKENQGSAGLCCALAPPNGCSGFITHQKLQPPCSLLMIDLATFALVSLQVHLLSLYSDTSQKKDNQTKAKGR